MSDIFLIIFGVNVIFVLDLKKIIQIVFLFSRDKDILFWKEKIQTI